MHICPEHRGHCDNVAANRSGFISTTMGFQRAKEDRPTPPEVYNWRIYAFAVIVSFGVLAYGYDSSFIGTTIAQPAFKRDFGMLDMSKAEQDAVSSNLTSIYSAGGFFGALFMFFSLELLGRWWTIVISNSIFTVGAVLCTVPTTQLGLVYAGRLLTGLGVGGIAAVCPIYVAELSPPAIRGQLTGFFESAYQIGAVIGFWINFSIVHTIDPESSTTWRIPMGVQLVPAGMLALGVPFLRESPVWLIKQGRLEEAKKAYSYFRCLPAGHVYITEDCNFVQSELENGRGSSKSFANFLRDAAREAVSKGIWNRFVLVFVMFMWQGWSGAAAINYYSPTVFRSIGLTDTTLWTGVYGLIKAGGSIIFFTFFIDSVGRQKPWIVSCLACAACQYYLAGYIAVGRPQAGATDLSASTIAGGKAATAAIMIFGATWSFGANGLPWIISAEIFPASLRSISGPWAGMSVWLWTFVVTKALPSMYTSMEYGVYIFFASMLVLSSIYAAFFIHETKGLRSDQMDALFGRITDEQPSTRRDDESIHTEEDQDKRFTMRVEVV
ncbi:hypothetical protein CERZMDRAFT_121371 [Cercospora zeae-maydis SCOH1-5]|uniref:Major facilitator superfamily (MFS) profile domain-containing protein n=1 Tax=Cercospora zeae-maydis SCOH1-5 TaxID=717836 RepID=A0A6A6FF63_9PEZI|nr:hypothetical protein CERZMDRAFT_121371 [Cercospora zeae-maydis SCOH1-5]